MAPGDGGEDLRRELSQEPLAHSARSAAYTIVRVAITSSLFLSIVNETGQRFWPAGRSPQ